MVNIIATGAQVLVLEYVHIGHILKMYYFFKLLFCNYMQGSDKLTI